MAFVEVSAKKYIHEISSIVKDQLAVEEMLGISVNGQSYTITMRSPGNEEALVRGILLTEDVYTEVAENPTYIVTEKNKLGFITKVNALINPSKIKEGIDSKRNLMSVTSCGMCGKEEMDLSLGPAISHAKYLKASVIEGMFLSMREAQETFDQSGGSHASAAFDIDGNRLCIMEDIGRHNAVDKVIGQLLLDKKLKEASCILVSGRLSYEIVSKAYKAGIPFLAAVSAPSSMAVEVAQAVGITLLGFCRENKFTVYSNEQAIST